jgi:hypothetical protein
VRHVTFHDTASESSQEEIAEHYEEEQEGYPHVLEEYEENHESCHRYAQNPRLGGCPDLSKQEYQDY